MFLNQFCIFFSFPYFNYKTILVETYQLKLQMASYVASRNPIEFLVRNLWSFSHLKKKHLKNELVIIELCQFYLLFGHFVA